MTTTAKFCSICKKYLGDKAPFYLKINGSYWNLCSKDCLSKQYEHAQAYLDDMTTDMTTKTLRGTVKDLWPHLKVGMKIKRFLSAGAKEIHSGTIAEIRKDGLSISAIAPPLYTICDFDDGEIEIEIDEEPRINKRKGSMGSLWDQLKVGTKLRCIASQSKFEVLKADGDAIQLGYLDRPEEKCVPIYRYNLITSSEIEILEDAPNIPLSLDTGMTVENIVKMAYKDFLSTTKQ